MRSLRRRGEIVGQRGERVAREVENFQRIGEVENLARKFSQAASQFAAGACPRAGRPAIDQVLSVTVVEERDPVAGVLQIEGIKFLLSHEPRAKNG
ncbi:hypothetical protein ACFFYR_11930 [Paraburkholderia dipogonis]|uniref:hypothetical protein n=1 Tax=Paraburkholderia dipogonis TaxID=1211383 RepID=UPI0035EF42AE